MGGDFARAWATEAKGSTALATGWWPNLSATPRRRVISGELNYFGPDCFPRPNLSER